MKNIRFLLAWKGIALGNEAHANLTKDFMTIYVRGYQTMQQVDNAIEGVKRSTPEGLNPSFEVTGTVEINPNFQEFIKSNGGKYVMLDANDEKKAA